jgi:hypothetical protein
MRMLNEKTNSLVIHVKWNYNYLEFTTASP